MRYLFVVAIACIAQTPPPGVQYRHVCTFGSKFGVHPPKVLNKKAATAAMGQSDHPYGIGFPVGVTTDTQNRVWIADSGTNSVHMFDRDNGAYREFRRAGDTLFQQPAGIASDRAGRIYVTDAALGGVFVFFEKGEFDRALIPKGSNLRLSHPTAIVIADNRRTIYIADPPNKAILALNQEGEVNSTIPLPPDLPEPNSMAIVEHDLYVLGPMRHDVAIFTATGNPRGKTSWDEIRLPSAFAFDPARARFAVVNPRWMVIEMFNQSGGSLGTFGQQGEAVDQMQRIDALHIDDEGSVYAVDSRHGKVLIFEETSRRTQTRRQAEKQTFQTR